MEDLKQRTVRGGFAKLAGQVVTFTLQLVFLVVLARLLDPADFGFVAMVTAVTGFYGLFRDGGLSAAAIQKANVTDEQKSSLFWINILIGTVLTLLCLLTAPVLVLFYNEPRLFWVTIVISSGFIVGAAGAQHSAILQRELRFVTMAVIEALSVIAGTVVAIAMAVAGFGYWSLVVSALISVATGTAGMWMVVRWVPGAPRWTSNIGSMLHFGGTVTLNGVVVYLAYNLDKVLLGRFWGADALGLYGRAYQLINLPTAQLNNAVGGVAFSALSRLQNDDFQFKNYFLKGYSLVITMTAPITLFAFAFSEDIIRVVLGPKWIEAAMIFRLLAPTVLIFGIINPLGWLLLSTGRQRRSLAVALVIAPLCVTGYLIGLPYGSTGIALAYSTTMSLWVVPHIIWCLKDTMISPRELVLAMWPPLGSSIVAAAVALLAQSYFGHWQSPVWRLLFGGCVMGAAYGGMLLFVMGQKSFYLGLLIQLKTSRGS
jgi:O-antigen/teichoic acid export membrane protein